MNKMYNNNIKLHAGSLSMLYQPSNAFLRHILFNDIEILRGIYFTLRDHRWDTIPSDIKYLSIENNKNSFKIYSELSFKKNKIHFDINLNISGNNNGSINYTFQGQSKKNFKKNRIGICVLHPLLLAGKKCKIINNDGVIINSKFPNYISPHQPFKNIKSITYETVNNYQIEVIFNGETFEMEDQRNWTDGSFKTYCTPLSLPFPIKIHEGETLKQSIKLNLKNKFNKKIFISNVNKEVYISLNHKNSFIIPKIGIGINNHKQKISKDDIKIIKLLNLSYLRLEINFFENNWKNKFINSILQYFVLNIPFEIIIIFQKELAEFQLYEIINIIQKYKLKIIRLIILNRSEFTINEKHVKLTRNLFSKLNITIPIVSGTYYYFSEINRNYTPINLLDGVCYSISPQCHAYDDLSLIETLEVQKMTVQTSRKLFCDIPIHISHITLLPKANIHDKNKFISKKSNFLNHDPRQKTFFGACWTLGSLKHLSESKVKSISYYEMFGENGLIDKSNNILFPMWYVFYWLGNLKHGCAIETYSSNPLIVHMFTIEINGWLHILLVNYSYEKQKIKIYLQNVKNKLSINFLNKNTIYGNSLFYYDYLKNYKFKEYIKNNDTFYVEIQPLTIAQGKIEKIVG